MYRPKLAIGVCVFGFSMSGCAVSEPPHYITEEVAWGYEETNGPDVWGQLTPGYVLCDEGTLQSPIDLVAPTVSALSAITFNYQPSQMSIHHNGHTIEVALAEENWIEIDGKRYDLLQFHFHTPSEHTVANESFEMEMHLVHRNEAGTLAVVGVLIAQGDGNEAFVPLWEQLPAMAGETNQIENGAVDAGDLLPVDRQTYRYDGSLTTPPCSEGVKWIVLTTPIELSDTQIADFKAIVHANNRPVQLLNERELLLDTTPNSR